MGGIGTHIRSALLVATVASLAVAAPAAAKEITALKICGEAGCSSADLRTQRVSAHFETGGSPKSPPSLATYYLVELGMGAEGKTYARMRGWFLPEAGLFRPRDDPSSGWVRIPGSQLEILRDVASEVRPFPSPRPSSVVVGGHRSADPARYAALLGLPPSAFPADTSHSVTLTLRWTRPNPWSEESKLEYFPRSNVVLTATGYADVADGLAASLEREAAGLPPVAQSSGRPWRLLAASVAGAAAVAVAAAALLLVVRRRRRGTPEPVTA